MGRVKSYNTRKGFGFIMVPEFPRDVFVYNSHLIGRIGLLPGEPVLFDLVVEGGRPQARNVKVTGDATPVEQENSAENLATIKKVIAEQMPHLQPAPGGQSMRDYTLAMAAAAAEVPTTMPAGAQAKSPEELLKEQIRKDVSRKSEEERTVCVAACGPRLARAMRPLGSKIKVVEFPAPDVNGCRELGALGSGKRPDRSEAAASSSSALPEPVPVARSAAKPLIRQKEARRKAKAKAPLSVAERQARNKRLAKQYQEERLRSAFGKSRNEDGNHKRHLIAEEFREDPQEVAPTRSKVNKMEENVQSLAKKPDVQMSDLLLKVLNNMKKK
ncbi:unnamed protein product [Durusdinium trenchii]|uniref:CSD domain-containing protein n=1 Tax=Durusdinium trenchii TaxID=1381693 RepID=A0ABP0N6E5_9DINO